MPDEIAVAVGTAFSVGAVSSAAPSPAVVSSPVTGGCPVAGHQRDAGAAAGDVPATVCRLRGKSASSGDVYNQYRVNGDAHATASGNGNGSATSTSNGRATARNRLFIGGKDCAPPETPPPPRCQHAGAGTGQFASSNGSAARVESPQPHQGSAGGAGGRGAVTVANGTAGGSTRWPAGRRSGSCPLPHGIHAAMEQQQKDFGLDKASPSAPPDVSGRLGGREVIASGRNFARGSI